MMSIGIKEDKNAKMYPHKVKGDFEMIFAKKETAQEFMREINKLSNKYGGSYFD